VEDKIILTPDMYVLRYHKYIMVNRYAAGSRGWRGTLLTSVAWWQAVHSREGKLPEISLDRRLVIYYFSPLTYLCRPGRPEEAYDGF
jgi:hypothetical protein